MEKVRWNNIPWKRETLSQLKYRRKYVDECHDLYLKSDTLVLVDVFENFRKTHLKIFHLDPVKFILEPGLAWQAAITAI